ncbi:MAG: methionine adenosyltransferase [Hyphomicrobiales bacterium]
MDALVISPLELSDETIEVVERKGLGHPDTICDALAETLSRNLCREYRRRFGMILHHNVDKALLSGGRAAAEFGGGSVLAPINIYLAGRATSQVGADVVPIAEIAVEGSRAWLRSNLHALDADRHVVIHSLIQPGSADLSALFSRRSEADIPLANDTSIGVGYAPMSSVERLVLAVEKRINARNGDPVPPAWGEDVKVMGVRTGTTMRLSIACAMIGRYVYNLEEYFAEKSSIAELARDLAAQYGFTSIDVAVNAADDRSSNGIYLTVTGTSAEAGDDGEVGRGNRVNGLITPGRPMSLEAAAGKNPVTHVGKLYNVTARDIAAAIVRDVPEITAAQCLLVSQIGAPIIRPAFLHLKLSTTDGMPVSQVPPRVEEIVQEHLSRIPKLIDDFVAGTIEIF